MTSRMKYRRQRTKFPAVLFGVALLFPRLEAFPVLSRPGKHVALASHRRVSRPMLRSLRLHGQAEERLDSILQGGDLREAVRFIRLNPDIDLSINSRWDTLFKAVERASANAERKESLFLGGEPENGMSFNARREIFDLYSILSKSGQLRLFGGVTQDAWPAAGSHTVDPVLLERISGLSMKALAPRKSISYAMIIAGTAAAILEGLLSVTLGIDLNFLVFLTVAFALADRVALGGAFQESFVKLIMPQAQSKIIRHEAGHFLCAYLLGCPVDGYVLSAWEALQDARFKSRGITAGTSFFDLRLADEMALSRVTRSSVDRYSIIVMAGIAAEAINYGQADGGAGDEAALIAFLGSLNGGNDRRAIPWNEITIRNQARWGALQAVLLIREYRECYEALVASMERNDSLADCILAIESVGRESGKHPMRAPLGHINETGALDTISEWLPNR